LFVLDASITRPFQVTVHPDPQRNILLGGKLLGEIGSFPNIRFEAPIEGLGLGLIVGPMPAFPAIDIQPDPPGVLFEHDPSVLAFLPRHVTLLSTGTMPVNQSPLSFSLPPLSFWRWRK